MPKETEYLLNRWGAVSDYGALEQLETPDIHTPYGVIYGKNSECYKLGHEPGVLYFNETIRNLIERALPDQSNPTRDRVLGEFMRERMAQFEGVVAVLWELCGMEPDVRGKPYYKYNFCYDGFLSDKNCKDVTRIYMVIDYDFEAWEEVLKELLSYLQAIVDKTAPSPKVRI